MKKNNPSHYHKRTIDELNDFIKKLELQALETAEERIPLYLETGFKDAKKILDVGCGSGAVTRDIAHLTKGTVFAIDGSTNLINVAQNILKDYTNVNLLISDAQHIPFKNKTFDITTCNLLLMWADNPQQVVNEMTRVTKKGGTVLASLEPDYGGKIHWPEQPQIDQLFAGEAIKKKGGDPHIGRKLRMLFTLRD